MAPSRGLPNHRASNQHERASTSGAGKYHVSPLRPRAGRMKRLVKPTKDQAMRSAALRSELAALLNGETPTKTHESPMPQSDAVESMEWEDEELDVAEEMVFPAPIHVPLPQRDPPAVAQSRLSLLGAWQVLLPALEAPWTTFRTATYASPPSHIPPSVHYACESGCTSLTHSTVQCLYPTRTFSQYDNGRVLKKLQICKPCPSPHVTAGLSAQFLSNMEFSPRHQDGLA
ncbi:hypothetical protein MIND_01150900 [Mycena indigotica]|uniref:Uncharacterized protein n=1 Tax=Mycena indigotica TaxID=2126181 RepID=A0A8H6S7A2_9AGAR|nr:uncharacterized protein MIND_01150900 [Mycena indigotica]KAF7293707.1 hypothetical protein MIND_01150900 [Mycena indigotica]